MFLSGKKESRFPLYTFLIIVALLVCAIVFGYAYSPLISTLLHKEKTLSDVRLNNDRGVVEVIDREKKYLVVRTLDEYTNNTLFKRYSFDHTINLAKRNGFERDGILYALGDVYPVGMESVHPGDLVYVEYIPKEGRFFATYLLVESSSPLL